MKICLKKKKEGFEDYTQRKIKKVKNLFQTSFFKSACISAIAGLFISVYPYVSNIIERKVESFRADADDIEKIVLQIAGFIATGGAGYSIYDRMTNQQKFYTPRGFPGMNIEEALENEDEYQ